GVLYGVVLVRVAIDVLDAVDDLRGRRPLPTPARPPRLFQCDGVALDVFGACHCHLRGGGVRLATCTSDIAICSLYVKTFESGLTSSRHWSRRRRGRRNGRPS